MRICTIIARNYLSYARVLAESFRQQHPDGSCSVLVIDDVAGEIDSASEPFEVLRPDFLGIDRFEAMAAMYDVTELATAVKPWLLEGLLADEHEGPVAYFDPDIRFYAPIDEIGRLAGRHELLLIPHIASPIPVDGLQPSEIDLMASGIYNLGFVAMGPGERTRQLLHWWQERLRFDCVIDHALGYFVDQRWFDLVPSFFDDVEILRDPTVNVAYWNLHERIIRSDHGGWLVNGEPLKFFHFSGFAPDRPHEVSKHQTRVRLSQFPDLARLYREYAREVINHRHAADDGPGYVWSTLGDGRALDGRLRRLYRDGERAGAFRHSPFEVEGAHEFTAWLNQPAPELGDAGAVSRFWYDVYRSRADLQLNFRDLAGDSSGFVEWIARAGHEAGDIRGLVDGEDRAEGDQVERDMTTVCGSPVSRSEPWGVNVAGFLQSELGIAEAARAVISGLDAARVPLLPVHGDWRPNSRQDHAYAMLDTRDAAFPVNIVCVNADVLAAWAQAAGPDFFAGRYTIGFWWWEVDTFPEQWLPAFDLVDEVWVASQHVADSIAPVAGVPVIKLVMPFDPPLMRLRSRAELRLPDDFLFMFAFDFHSVLERKNPLGVIEAFKRAFAPGAGASLVLKSINHEYHPAERERLAVAAADHPDIHLIDRYVSPEDKNAMIASCDCYVSLHRSEGFGLTMAEAMYMGKPVVATRYGGNLEFMTDANSWLVDYELTPIGEGHEPYPAAGRWASPDVAQAAEHMRDIFVDPQGARERARGGALELAERHSARIAGGHMRRRLEHVRARRDHWPERVPQLADQVDLTSLRELVSGGPGQPTPSARPASGRRTKPYTARQDMVETEVLGAIERLVSEQEQLKAAAHDARVGQIVRTAGQLAELRRQTQLAKETAALLEQVRAGQDGR